MKTQGDNDLIQKLINQYEESNKKFREMIFDTVLYSDCLLYTSPSPRDVEESRMPSSA